jgi:signal transduction histidine kinase
LQLPVLPRELLTLGISINTALNRLSATYLQLETFNADVAHELRTPVTNLIGQTQVALSRERSVPELREYCSPTWKSWSACVALWRTCCFWPVQNRDAGL